ncbi:phage terminase small subunit-related protein [Melioribacter sp. Ez-97]|uniref:phage terminase small subunit-related protein n=1 Tax=unclassified Melioribacter TaxID=2627329 RepID=UPI003EDA9AAD
MGDPAVREKAKQLFVENGLSMDTIVKLLDGEVSRKTLYNWRKQDGWDDLRKAKVERTAKLRERLERLLEAAITDAETNLNPRSIFAVGKLVAALRASEYVNFSDEKLEKERNVKQGLSPENLEKLEKELGVL